MRLAVVSILKKWVLALAAVAVLIAGGVLAANAWIVARTQDRIEGELPLCASEPVGVVFGTSYWARGGGRNPHYAARLEAASRLLRLKRVQHLLLSGDNRTRFYNEPVTMWRDLRAANVRNSDMTLDYAGFSTFDTLVRAKEVFGLERILLITQDWHLPRALFIAEALGLEAAGCAIPTDPVAGTWQLRMREWLARVGMLGDLYLWGREPHFLGPREPIKIAPSTP
ncbi:SanA protein [Modicisalibacter ilicicola DSM 19980]|uniref:SanA protein n=1 Tax=Modicisalibacter ilicicola DSM 19980 TaxID=1121942 RepID=A0A1M4SA08_9GAMM|nr:ElyC/SanA/YdcF family protein [Halomonas ilicicola]SHE29030.1 SanA protein [Halomonas ilicicola DSM 19980]